MQAKLSAVADLKNYPGRVWKILRRMRKDSADVRTFMKSDEVSSFRSHTGPAFVLLQTPEHGNMGDHAIAFAEKKFLRDAFPEVPVYEFPFRACELRLKEIAAGTAPQDIVLITGGGFAGTLWKWEQKVLLQILNTFAGNRMVMFPQTVYFDDPEGEKAQKFASALKKCRDLTVFLRDRASYEQMKRFFPAPGVQYREAPDMVTWLGPCKNDCKRVIPPQALLCLRDDKEGILPDGERKELTAILSGAGFAVTDFSTVLDRNVGISEREEALNEMLRKISSSSLVVTDRLHAMLFSAVTQTPCLALDNLSRKVSGQYRWVKYLPYIMHCSPGEITGETDFAFGIEGAENTKSSSKNSESKYKTSSWEESIREAVGVGMRVADGSCTPLFTRVPLEPAFAGLRACLQPDRAALTPEQEAFFRILSDHIHGRTTEPCALNWPALREIAQNHQVAAFICAQCGEWMGEKSFFEQSFQKTIYRSLQYRSLRDAVLSHLKEAGISAFTVKGISVADCYPQPLLRAMGDIDLVAGERREAGRVLEKLGFTYDPSGRDDWEWDYRNGDLLIELHDRLLYNSEETDQVQNNFFNDFEPYVHGQEPDWNFHLLFLLVHLYRHLLKTGAGFRHFLDLAVVVQKHPPDTGWLAERLRELKLYDFALTCFALSERWFGVPSPFGPARREELQEDFVLTAARRIFSDGVFGRENESNLDNSALQAAALGGGQRLPALIGRMWRTVFLPYRELRHLPGYHFLKGRPYLLPAAWCKRLVLRVIQGDAARFLSHALPSGEAVKERREFLKKWGIE